jgi:hypothetical protein
MDPRRATALMQYAVFAAQYTKLDPCGKVIMAHYPIGPRPCRRLLEAPNVGPNFSIPTSLTNKDPSTVLTLPRGQLGIVLYRRGTTSATAQGLFTSLEAPATHPKPEVQHSSRRCPMFHGVRLRFHQL